MRPFSFSVGMPSGTTSHQKIMLSFRMINKEYVSHVLEARCGYNPEDDLGTLGERSLIKINASGEISMHNLLRDMGREIIHKESPDHPGKRSRIWQCEDAWNVLSKQMVITKCIHKTTSMHGTEVVEGLALDVRASENKLLSTGSFTKMRCLKLLQINGVHLFGPFKLLSEELIWICWLECPLKSFPSDFMLDKLVVLEMQYSNIKELWKEKKASYNRCYGYHIRTVDARLLLKHPIGFRYHAEGCSLSFHIPQVFQGLLFWAFSTRIFFSSSHTIKAIIRKKSNGMQLFEATQVVGLYCPLSWVRYVKLELYVNLGSDDINVKQCGIHVVVDWDPFRAIEWDPDIESGNVTSPTSHLLDHPLYGSIAFTTMEKWKDKLLNSPGNAKHRIIFEMRIPCDQNLGWFMGKNFNTERIDYFIFTNYKDCNIIVRASKLWVLSLCCLKLATAINTCPHRVVTRSSHTSTL
ncbi:disease resistance protein [Salix suchowensis]|nr:disease resistance protein [Salix suchowensis]